MVNFSLDELSGQDNELFRNLLTSKVGVGFDGKKFVFCRFKRSIETIDVYNSYKTKKFPSLINKKQELSFEIEVIDDFELGVKKLLLFARSTERKFLSASNLSKSFASSSDLTQKNIKYFYDLLECNLAKNPRINTLYSEWNRIFGDIYGKDETDFTKFKDELVKMYSLPLGMEIRKCLFVLQTYYSIVTKLLIHNLLESLSDPTSKAKKPSSKSDLKSLFSGNHYMNYSIDNFFEIHFFEWFIMAEDLDIDLISDIINELDMYETTASVIKPEIVGDVLKKLYANFIPRELRHLMGEYYTPDWLVDFTIEKSKYDYGLESSVLDPTCGSGTFITHLIKKYRDIYKNKIDPNSLIEIITKNIVGFDINPIAVISAKANYILSLGDITKLNKEISIPIYMCDSILVPTVHAKQKEKKHSIDIETVVGKFEVPVFKTREDNDYFLKNISECVLGEYTFEEFFNLIDKEGILTISENQFDVVKAFYDKLFNLHLSGKNGFWYYYIKKLICSSIFS
ncbi:N-6 DNA methylase [Aliarcobacter butzleri]|uniref:N-6 DNA methylase n=1 Tax=Aliarcobacter butzleri TaxID=28197 RepID=UPI003AFB47DD